MSRPSHFKFLHLATFLCPLYGLNLRTKYLNESLVQEFRHLIRLE